MRWHAAIPFLAVTIAFTPGTPPGAEPSMDPVVSTDPAAAPHVEIEIRSLEYAPRALTIPVGTTVTWINRDDKLHTATSAASDAQGFARSFGSPPLQPGQTFSRRFVAPGTYPYFDAFDRRLSGTIVVPPRGP